MENAKRRRINKKNMDNVNENESRIDSKKNGEFDLKYVIKDFFYFYKKKLMKKHIIVYIICLVVFFIMIASLIYKINSVPNIAELAEKAKEASNNATSIFSLIISKKVPLVFMIIMAGIVPYFFIPIIGISVSYSLAVDIATSFNVMTARGSVIPMCIGAIIELVAIALAIATGIQYCILSTKKWRYSRNQDYSMLDFKRTFYEATNNAKKLSEVNKKKETKSKKNEKNNVKVPYLHLIISFIISAVIIMIGTIISKV